VYIKRELMLDNRGSPPCFWLLVKLSLGLVFGGVIPIDMGGCISPSNDNPVGIYVHTHLTSTMSGIVSL
jgi:hypothetical protein